VVDSEAIIAIMAKEAVIDPSRLTPNATLKDLSITSLEVLEILFAIEDKYQLEFGPAEFENVHTVQEFMDVVLAKAAASPQTTAVG
jgi:acyl carrier protein